MLRLILASALALGMLAERMRQSAILGYLAAGTIVGPNVLGWVEAGERINLLAELGASLLLFAIGLEFSIPRLRQLGGRVLAAGVLQITLTLAAGLGVAMALGFSIGTAFALGSILALSSTAVVARLLIESRALDSGHGRRAMGVRCRMRASHFSSTSQRRHPGHSATAHTPTPNRNRERMHHGSP
jgi:CPA2 family monovalent cation:H+ antiporter-2